MCTARQLLVVGPAVLAASVAASGCADDNGSTALNLDDEMLISVVGDCVEFDLPNEHSSACAAGVGGNVMGPNGDQWFAGFAPTETDLVASNDAEADRFLEVDDLKVFAIPYEPGNEIVALDDEGLALFTYSTPDE